MVQLTLQDNQIRFSQCEDFHTHHETMDTEMN